MGIRHMIPMLEPSRAFRSPMLNPPTVPAAPFNWQPPQILGGDGVADGRLLVGILGFWTGYGTLTYAYSWRRDGVEVGTGITYTYQFPDDFADITFVVSVTDSLGQITTLASAPLQSITALNLEDVLTLHTFLNTTYPTEFLSDTDGTALTTLNTTLATPGYWG